MGPSLDLLPIAEVALWHQLAGSWHPSERPVADALGLAFNGGLVPLAGPAAHFVPWPEIVFLGSAVQSLETLVQSKRWLGREENDAHLAALVVGALIPYCAISASLELHGGSGALPVALPLVGLASYVGWRGRASGVMGNPP